jgi:AAA15 family ATPase/GTPase
LVVPSSSFVPPQQTFSPVLLGKPLYAMENAIKFLRIQNFKSIKDVTLHPRRVNLIVGEPNVGKSNLLEAMTLLGGIVYEQTEKFMGSFIRYEEPRQLFYDNLLGNTIKVETDRDVAYLLYENSAKEFRFLFTETHFYKSLADSVTMSDLSKFRQSMQAAIMNMVSQGEIASTVHENSPYSKLVHTEFNSKAIFKVRWSS